MSIIGMKGNISWRVRCPNSVKHSGMGEGKGDGTQECKMKKTKREQSNAIYLGQKDKIFTISQKIILERRSPMGEKIQ